MKIKHINFNEEYINLPGTITKNGRPREIPFLYDELKETLNNMHLEQYDKEDFLFTINKCPGNKMVSKNYFGNHYLKVKKTIPSRTKHHDLYSFRHLFALNYMLDGLESPDINDNSKELKIFELQVLLGHNDLRQTQEYLRKFGNKLLQKKARKNTVKFGE